MSYQITTIPKFDKQAKALAKKYPSLKATLQNWLTYYQRTHGQGDCFLMMFIRYESIKMH